MDFFIDNAIPIMDWGVFAASFIGMIYCVWFVAKIKKNGTEIQKQAVKNAAAETLILTLAIFIFVNVVALLIFVLGEVGYSDPISLVGSAFPIRLFGIVALIFCGSYGNKRRLLENEKS